MLVIHPALGIIIIYFDLFDLALCLKELLMHISANTSMPFFKTQNLFLTAQENCMSLLVLCTRSQYTYVKLWTNRSPYIWKNMVRLTMTCVLTSTRPLAWFIGWLDVTKVSYNTLLYNFASGRHSVASRDEPILVSCQAGYKICSCSLKRWTHRRQIWHQIFDKLCYRLLLSWIYHLVVRIWNFTIMHLYAYYAY